MAERSWIAARLRDLGQGGGATLDLAEAALLLAAYERPDLDLEASRRHLAELAAAAGAARKPDLVASIAAANCVIYDQNGYRGDSTTYDDLRNADLAHVIERRRGLPVALGILHLHVSRAQGLASHGINAPGHFLTEIAGGGRRVLCDPFHGGRLLDGEGLRRLFGEESDVATGLEAGSYPPMADRDVLLRLQNNIKTRALAAGDRERAIRALESMVFLAPDARPEWRELAGLYADGDRIRAAIMALEQAGEGKAALDGLRRRLN